MSRPKSMTGAIATVKIDGVDLKEYGVVINTLDDGSPAARDVAEIVPLRHGDIDNTKIYEAKTFNLTGDIAADTAADLITNIDAVKKLIRLREDAAQFDIEFQHRAGYVWHCRLISFSIDHKASWYNGTKAAISISLKAPESFSEASSSTELTGRMKMACVQAITYNGNAPAALDINIKGIALRNKLFGVSDSTTPWTGVNATLTTDTGSTFFPVIYGQYQLKCSQSAAGAFSAWCDIGPVLSTSKYYMLCAYVRVNSGSSSNVRCKIESDVAATVNGNYIGNYTSLGRTFVKINGADYVGNTYVRLKIESDTNNSVFFYDGICMYEITAAEYADANFLPYPYTDYVSETTYQFKKPYVEITGKNLCPAGAADCDNGRWFLGKYNVINDITVGRMAVVSVGNGSNRYLRTRCFRLDPGQYTLSFKYKAVTAGTIILSVFTVGEQLAGSMNQGLLTDYWDGFIVNESLSVASTAWQTKTKTFTVPDGVPWVILGFYDNLGASWEELRVAEIQVESGAAQTAFEAYWNEKFYWDDTISSDEKLIVEGKYGNVLFINNAPSVDNGMSKFTGSFLTLRPGTNNIIFYDGRAFQIQPHYYGSGCMDYAIMRRDRYL